MKVQSRRPRSFHEISCRVLSGEQQFDAAVREFLDVFYTHAEDRQFSISLRPFNLDDIKDAYLASVAEHLARSNGLEVPAWSDNHGTRLRKPFFAGGLDSLKAVLTVQSPAAFRRRLLFVSHDALDRPRRMRPAQKVPPLATPPA